MRAELVAQRQATDILTNEVKSLKSQLVSQVANLTHLVMTLAMEKPPDEDPADPTASESADASPAVRESGEGEAPDREGLVAKARAANAFKIHVTTM